MGGYSGFPDIQGFYDMLYGTGGVDLLALTGSWFGPASGIVFPGNPPYTVTDFIQTYPKFVGPPSNFTGLTITTNSNIISGFTGGFADVTGLAVGQLLVNLNSIVKDTIITAVDLIGLTITISQPAIANDTVLTVYEAPFVPLLVIQTYLWLALTSLSSQRYCAAWTMAMNYFIAHYCTLYLRSESGPNLTAAQIASSGLERGLIAAKSAGGVSAGIKFMDDYLAWGAFQETTYGIQLITIARSIAMGPVYFV